MTLPRSEVSDDDPLLPEPRLDARLPVAAPCDPPPLDRLALGRLAPEERLDPDERLAPEERLPPVERLDPDERFAPEERLPPDEERVVFAPEERLPPDEPPAFAPEERLPPEEPVVFLPVEPALRLACVPLDAAAARLRLPLELEPPDALLVLPLPAPADRRDPLRLLVLSPVVFRLVCLRFSLAMVSHLSRVYPALPGGLDQITGA